MLTKLLKAVKIVPIAEFAVVLVATADWKIPITKIDRPRAIPSPNKRFIYLVQFSILSLKILENRYLKIYNTQSFSYLKGKFEGHL